MQRRFGLTSGMKRGEYRVVMSNDNALGEQNCPAAVDGACSAEPHVTGKHTPGPWHWYGDKGLEARNETLLVGDCGSVSCGRSRLLVSAANAHLIAAAPDLYEALRLIVAHFGDPLKVAAAALAKAEGQ